MLHVVGIPRHFFTAGEQRRSQRFIPASVADVPLATGDDFQWTISLFVELHRVRDWPWLGLQVAGCAQQLNDQCLCLLHRFSCQRCVLSATTLRNDCRRRLGKNSTVATDDCASGQIELTPPHHVGEVTEGANHGDAGALVGLGEWVRVHTDFHIEQWRSNGLAEERCITRIVGMRNQTNAGRNQLGSGRFDDDVTSRTVERDRMISAGAFAILQLCLCNRSAEVDIPQRRCFLCVGLAACQVVEKCLL